MSQFNSSGRYKFRFKGFAMNVAVDASIKKAVEKNIANGFTLDKFVSELVSDGYSVKFTPDGSEEVITVSIMGMPNTVNDGMILSQRHNDIDKASAVLYHLHYEIGNGAEWPTKTDINW